MGRHFKTHSDRVRTSNIFENIHFKPIVLAAEEELEPTEAGEHGEAGHAEEDPFRWDWWGRWLMPFLWSIVEIVCLNGPGEIFAEFLASTMSFLTGHEFLILMMH